VDLHLFKQVLVEAVVLEVLDLLMMVMVEDQVVLEKELLLLEQIIQ